MSRESSGNYNGHVPPESEDDYGIELAETNSTYVDSELGHFNLYLNCMWNASRHYPTDGGTYCNATFDSLTCWPNAVAGTTIIASCPSEISGIKYDVTKNASRHCFENGTWAAYSNYNECTHLVDEESFDAFAESTRQIYLVGYSISLVAVIIALTIFLNFKDLRCLRNTFHANLMATYFLVDLCWIIMASLQVETESGHTAHCTLMIILYYFQGTNFFWMFVEGFYLYMLVVRTFTVDKLRFSVYIFIGWGMPAIVVFIWAFVKSRQTQATSHVSSPGTETCHWLFEKDAYDWIFSAPILIVLIVNLAFMGRIMWVLITKLRAATTAESQQYRKASKALLVLLPLLGITYVLVLVAPANGVVAEIFAYLRAVLLSTQGFTVSVLYCFMNGEVRNTLRHHLDRWRTAHHLEGKANRCSHRYREGSPRSRTESIRLCSGLNPDCRCDASPGNGSGGHGGGSGNNGPRESCVSCLTTNSYVGNGHSGTTSASATRKNSDVTAVTATAVGIGTGNNAAYHVLAAQKKNGLPRENAV